MSCISIYKYLEYMYICAMSWGCKTFFGYIKFVAYSLTFKILYCMYCRGLKCIIQLILARNQWYEYKDWITLTLYKNEDSELPFLKIGSRNPILSLPNYYLILFAVFLFLCLFVIYYKRN